MTWFGTCRKGRSTNAGTGFKKSLALTEVDFRKRCSECEANCKWKSMSVRHLFFSLFVGETGH